jgi:hypothetical protein
MYQPCLPGCLFYDQPGDIQIAQNLHGCIDLFISSAATSTSWASSTAQCIGQYLGRRRYVRVGQIAGL